MENLHHYKHDYEHNGGSFVLVGLEIIKVYLNTSCQYAKAQKMKRQLFLKIALFLLLPAVSWSQTRQQAVQQHGWYMLSEITALINIGDYIPNTNFTSMDLSKNGNNRSYGLGSIIHRPSLTLLLVTAGL